MARQLAGAWQLPDEVEVAYVYAEGRQDHERAFRADYAAVATEATGWLEIAVDLLATRAFPRTHREEDCTFCSFQPVCGPHRVGSRGADHRHRRGRPQPPAGVERRMMTEPRHPPLPDEAARRAAIDERARNVIVDAGAGTGKTTLIVSRLVAMVAPFSADATPVDLGRIAAVTFTRRCRRRAAPADPRAPAARAGRG